MLLLSAPIFGVVKGAVTRALKTLLLSAPITALWYLTIFSYLNQGCGKRWIYHGLRVSAVILLCSTERDDYKGTWNTIRGLIPRVLSCDVGGAVVVTGTLVPLSSAILFPWFFKSFWMRAQVVSAFELENDEYGNVIFTKIGLLEVKIWQFSSGNLVVLYILEQIHRSIVTFCGLGQQYD